MRHFDVPNINTPAYWDVSQTALDFGLRQQKYCDLIGACESVVELGCGLSPFLSKVPALRTAGVDFSPETIKRASAEYPHVQYVLADCTKTPFADKSFSVAVSGEVIEHLEKPEDLITEMERIALDMIIISTPHLEFDDPEHLWEFDEEYFLSKGFHVETVHSERFIGRSYLFAWKRLRSSQE